MKLSQLLSLALTISSISQTGLGFWRPTLDYVKANKKLPNICQFYGNGGTSCDLTSANLSGFNFTGANLKNADLTGANLTRAKLNNTLLKHANLTGANLTGADLTGAQLTGSKLNNANFKDANLKGAYIFSGINVPITKAMLKTAKALNVDSVKGLN